MGGASAPKCLKRVPGTLKRPSTNKHLTIYKNIELCMSDLLIHTWVFNTCVGRISSMVQQTILQGGV